ncbi:MAG: YkgJ family cysteine cluster protein [Desulfobacteraceae bacterium]|nr:YkgJ family cysteine cluster protein [Desulfobacteraceae bacterium]
MDSDFTTSDDIFNCTQCGECCSGFGGTYVNEEDVKRIAAFVNCDTATFTERYCDRSGTRLVLTQGDDGCCVFFDKNCTIHPVKPYMCRAWPFLRTIVKNPENWNAMSRACEGMKPDVPEDALKKIVAQEVEILDASYPFASND